MSRTLYLFSSELELDAALEGSTPDRALVDVSGVGLVDAAIGTARSIARYDPSRVVFVGTCGAHRDCGVAIGEIVYGTTVRLGSGDVARGEMRIPSLLPSDVACDEGLGRAIVASLGSDAPRGVRVSCTLGVTETDELARALAEHDASEVENLEAFSVVRAAGTLPTAVILGVTNIVGAGGGDDWRRNFRAMMKRLAACIETV